jgi:hypothetical protein
MNIHVVKRKYTKELMKLANVVGIYVGIKKTNGQSRGIKAIVVGVRKKLPVRLLDHKDIIPYALDGILTDVIELGDIEAHAIDPTARIRPIQPGYSIGNEVITAGTLGCVVRCEGIQALLSNAHVFCADPTNPPLDQKSINIIQPGSHDGGKYPEDLVADLYKYVPIKFVGAPSDCPVSRSYAGFGTILSKLFGRESRIQATVGNDTTNVIDAAVALAGNVEVNKTIPEIGIPTGIVEAKLSMPVEKFGRTTRHTKGMIEGIDATLQVGYGTGIALFEDQLIIRGNDGAFSDGGDSGSLIVESNPSEVRAVALLFAGNRQQRITIGCRIQNVEKLLDIRIGQN